MMLTELFDNSLPYKEISKYKFEFNVKSMIYNVDFREERLPKEAQLKLNRDEEVIGIEVDFSLRSTKLGFTHGITNTGNSIQVFSTVIKIIQEFLQKETPEFFYFSAEENSRRKLYDKMSKLLSHNTNYTLYHTLVNNYGKNYVFQIK